MFVLWFQALIQAPFGNGGSPTPEGLTLMPTTVGGDGIVTSDGGNIAQVATAGGSTFILHRKGWGVCSLAKASSQSDFCPLFLFFRPRRFIKQSGFYESSRRRYWHGQPPPTHTCQPQPAIILF